MLHIMEKERFEIQNVAMSLKWQLSNQKLLQIARKTGKAADQKKNNGQTKFPNHFGPFFLLWSTYSNTPSKNYRKDFMAISVSTMFFSICSRGVALSIRNIHMYVCMYVCICIYIYSYILSFGASAETPQALKLLLLRKRRSFDSSGLASIASRDAWDHQVCGVPRRRHRSLHRACPSGRDMGVS